jgi:hypothetical protein
MRAIASLSPAAGERVRVRVRGRNGQTAFEDSPLTPALSADAGERGQIAGEALVRVKPFIPT